VLGLQRVERALHARAHLHLARASGARDLEADHRPAVQQRRRARLGHGVAHLGQLVQADAAPARDRDLQRRDLPGRLHRGQRAQGLLGAAQLGAPARALQLHLAQLARDLGRRHAQGLEPERVERHAHLARGPAHAADRAHAGHGQQAARELVVHEPGQLLLVELARRDGERQDGLAGELQLGDHGVAQVRRQVGAHARDGRAHVVHRLLYWFFQLVLGGDGGRAVHQRGGDVLEPLRGGDGVLDLARHVRFELPRRRARQRGRDHDHGQVHVGEVLHLHGAEGQQPGQREQHEQHGRRHGVPDRPGGEVHGLRSLFGSW